MRKNPLIAAIADDDARSLVELAEGVSLHAYAKFSKFRVGAALRTTAGGVYLGCNVENGSYGLTSCAERNAVFAAIASEGPSMTIQAVGLFARSRRGLSTVSPCGACRQVLAEFSSPPEATMITFLRQGTFHTAALSDLLPDQFALDATPPPRDPTAPT